jgi:hypothetical protein
LDSASQSAVSRLAVRGMAKVGPQERSPTGGYFIAAAKARASATELIIGAITASAPKSSARLAMSKRPTGMRTMRHACRRAGSAQAAQHAVLVVAAMLHVERDGVESLRRQHLDRQRDPACPTRR